MSNLALNGTPGFDLDNMSDLGNESPRSITFFDQKDRWKDQVQKMRQMFVERGPIIVQNLGDDEKSLELKSIDFDKLISVLKAAGELQLLDPPDPEGMEFMEVKKDENGNYDIDDYILKSLEAIVIICPEVSRNYVDSGSVSNVYNSDSEEMMNESTGGQNIKIRKSKFNKTYKKYKKINKKPKKINKKSKKINKKKSNKRKTSRNK
jgi:hypothetical protein